MQDELTFMQQQLKRIADALEGGRVFGQTTMPNDEVPDVALTAEQGDLIKMAAARAEKNIVRRGTDPTYGGVNSAYIVEEITDAIKACIDFRQDTEKKLARAYGELSELRRKSNSDKCAGIKQCMAMVRAWDGKASSRLLLDMGALLELNGGTQ